MTTPDPDPVTIDDFRPTHVVPPDGLPAWEAPDPSRPTVPLDALLPVQLVERLGDWGRIVCANGWSAWVDGRLLVAVPQSPPEAGSSLTRTADPRPLLARVEEALSRYRSAAEDLAAGRLDGESFRGITQGQRIGVVVDGESLWLYDAEHERWVYCDGTRLSTYAVTEDPAAPPERIEGARGGARGRAPTDVVRNGAGTTEPPTGVVREGAGNPEPSTGVVREPDDREPTRFVPRVTDQPGDR
ncbi:hypothetical protein OG762_43980 [Streptomyces sp. NBC_01136]|uniref:hypothetical protein n=1 Tax=unclassified Streptomyces TaxID=2593676 RepID=UPI003248033D|nr:hypothetical protein OG762_43980 [Streptomyces sp. NBC_01136]